MIERRPPQAMAQCLRALFQLPGRRLPAHRQRHALCRRQCGERRLSPGPVRRGQRHRRHDRGRRPPDRRSRRHGRQAGRRLLCTPCGGCRQRLREFCGADTPIHVCGPEGVRRTLTLDELLPFSFGPENLSFVRSHASHGPQLAQCHPSEDCTPSRRRARPPASRPASASCSVPASAGSRTGSRSPSRSPTPTCPASREPGVHGHAGQLVLGTLGGVRGRLPAGPRPSLRGHGARRRSSIPVRTLKLTRLRDAVPDQRRRLAAARDGRRAA